MKVTNRIMTLLLALCLPGALVLGQEKKNEQRIKIITDDGSGKKVVIDSVFYGKIDGDTIKIKGGQAIVIGKTDGTTATVSHGAAKKVSVIVNTDTDADINTNENVQVETITVIAGDTVSTPGEKGKTIVIRKSPGGGEKGKMEYIISESKSGEGSGKGKVYYFTSADKDSDINADKAEIFIHRKDNDLVKEAEVRYVIARNGMVVTIEGNDEAKAKALFDDVQKKLEQLSPGKSQQVTGKENPPKDKVK